MDLIQARTIGEAWIAAVQLLERRGGQLWDLGVEISDPQAEEDGQLRDALDAELLRLSKHSVATVANTIFPQILWETCGGDREKLYERYLRVDSRLRRFPGNHRGLYFERFIRWPPGTIPGYNQLEEVIRRLHTQLKRPNPLRLIYDLAVFSPINDPMPLGFPCLTYVNLKLDGRILRMTAYYRSHYFIERAYGNYLGLSRLQVFIAQAASLQPGPLVCHSGHARLDHRTSRILSGSQGSTINQQGVRNGT
jgi:thymidylate synthase